MRGAHDTLPGTGSGTPIYDSLYAEYRRLFRALPGDRTGEEELRFEGFGTVHGTGTGNWDTTAWHSGSWSSNWGVEAARQRPLAALPPGPRDGHAYGL
ncbi:hypothetical protein ACWGJ2_38920 [Streptomyces sp. NPDC054796]